MGRSGVALSNGIRNAWPQRPGTYFDSVGRRTYVGDVMAEQPEKGKKPLNDSELLECLDAIHALEVSGGRAAVTVLCGLRQHPHPGIRMAAAKALGSFRQPVVVRSLLGWLLDEPNAMVQTWIVISLGQVGDAAVVPHLLGLLGQTSSPMLRQVLIRALGVLGDASVIDAIRVFAEDQDWHVRKDVEEALKTLYGKSGE